MNWQYDLAFESRLLGHWNSVYLRPVSGPVGGEPVSVLLASVGVIVVGDEVVF